MMQTANDHFIFIFDSRLASDAGVQRKRHFPRGLIFYRHTGFSRQVPYSYS